MTPDDYQAMNDVLIAQAGDMEILIQGQQERIRDLEARAKFWKHYAKFYWKGHRSVCDMIMPWFKRTERAEAEVERLKAENLQLRKNEGKLLSEIVALHTASPYVPKWD